VSLMSVRVTHSVSLLMLLCLLSLWFSKKPTRWKLGVRERRSVSPTDSGVSENPIHRKLPVSEKTPSRQCGE
jgi:hypothetical protein